MATVLETKLIGVGFDAKSAKQISDDCEAQLKAWKAQKRQFKAEVDRNQAEVDRCTDEINRLQALIGGP
jgi:peptidoglycan hydrolase CwlO-like protein